MHTDFLLKHLNFLRLDTSRSQRDKVNAMFISWDSVTSESSATFSPLIHAVYIITSFFTLKRTNI